MNLYRIISPFLLFALCKCNSGQIGLVRDNPANTVDLDALTKVNQYLEHRVSTRFFLYNDDDIGFYVYTKTGKTKLHYDQANFLSATGGFSTSQKTVFVIHGWANTPNDLFVLIKSLLDHGNVNVIAVDWSATSYLGYLTAITQLPNVGNTIASFIQSMSSIYNYSLDLVILMGHSLGAHVSGFAGKSLNGNIGVIFGLDPAGPSFFESLPSLRLNATDAKYVQAIHTNAGLLGAPFDLGKADFWPNGGCEQPGCDGIDFFICAHNRSFIYMAESINNDNFYARKCDSYSNYLSGICATNTQARMGGYTYDTNAVGDFYLNTASQSLYALGNI